MSAPRSARPPAPQIHLAHAPEVFAPTLPETPSVAVILPVRNGAPHIERALAALLAGDWPPDRLRVWVADGRSTDGTRALVRRIAADDPHGRVRLLDNPARITPAGLNVALATAQGEVVLRLDAHALPAPDYVRRCVSALRVSGAWAVGGPMVGRGDSAFGRAVALATALPLGTGGAAFRVAPPPDADAPSVPRAVDTVYLGAWPRAVLERLGGFDEGLPTNQDYELCLRIRALGGTVWLDPAIRSTTLTRGTPKALARQYHGYGRGRAATLRRHPGSLRPRQLAPAVFTALWAGLAVAAPWQAGARRGLAALATTYTAVLALVARRATRGPHDAAHDPYNVTRDPHAVARDPHAVTRDPRRALPTTEPPPDAPVRPEHVALAWATMHLAWGAGFWRGLLLDARRDRPGRRDRHDRRRSMRSAPTVPPVHPVHPARPAHPARPEERGP